MVLVPRYSHRHSETLKRQLILRQLLVRCQAPGADVHVFALGGIRQFEQLPERLNLYIAELEQHQVQTIAGFSKIYQWIMHGFNRVGHTPPMFVHHCQYLIV